MIYFPVSLERSASVSSQQKTRKWQTLHKRFHIFPFFPSSHCLPFELFILQFLCCAMMPEGPEMRYVSMKETDDENYHRCCLLCDDDTLLHAWTNIWGILEFEKGRHRRKLPDVHREASFGCLTNAFYNFFINECHALDARVDSIQFHIDRHNANNEKISRFALELIKARVHLMPLIAYLIFALYSLPCKSKCRTIIFPSSKRCRPLLHQFLENKHCT